MARQGRAGTALAIAAIGSFIAGTFATLVVAAFAPPLAEVALKFGPAEYFSLMVLGLIAAVVLASGSLLKAIAMIVLGLLLGIIGTDVNSGLQRYSFGMPELSDGIGFVVVAMGAVRLRRDHRQPRAAASTREVFTDKVSGLWLKWKDFKEALPAILRGTVLGSVLGILPGGGALLVRLRLLHAGKEDRQGPVALRQGRDRGRGGPGERQQRRRADVVHSAAHARHTAQRRDGADGRRDDDPQHPAGPAGDDQQSRSCSGA